MDIPDSDYISEQPASIRRSHGTLPDLEPLLRDQIQSRCRKLTFDAGETIFSQGARHSATYIIRDGLVRTFYTANSGREVTMAYWSRGDLVGGPNFFGGGFHVWSGMALRDSNVLAISGKDLRELARSNSEISLWITDMMVFKMRWLSILFQLRGTEAVGPRLAKLLLMLADIYGVPASDGIVIKHRMNQSDIATLVGASRQWTNKTLKRLQNIGLVAVDGQLIRIVDVAGLRALSDEASD